MNKSWIDMTEDERKAAVAKDKSDREALFVDAIENGPKRAEEATQAQLAEAATLAAEKEKAFKLSVKQSFVAANGNEWGFDAAWPALREEIVKQKTLANVGNNASSPDLVTRFLEQVNSR